MLNQVKLDCYPYNSKNKQNREVDSYYKFLFDQNKHKPASYQLRLANTTDALALR